MRNVNILALIGIVLLPLLISASSVLAETSAADLDQSGFRMGEWTQSTAAEFSAGQMTGIAVVNVGDGALRLSANADKGTYLSPEVTAEFEFNALAARWAADVPIASSFQVELRARTVAEGWSTWYPLNNVEWIPNKGEYALETPLMVSKGEQFQYRLTMTAASGSSGPGRSPTLHRMTITYLDTSFGPTTTEAQFHIQTVPPTIQGVPRPIVISRAGWGANEDYRTWNPEYRPVRKIVVHHTVTANDYDRDKAAAWVRAIYYYHAVTLGWGDIGYNYLVDQYGNIYEGRYGGPGVVAAHVLGYNYGSMGIGLIGTHGNAPNSVAPGQAALEATSRLAAWEASRSYVHPLESSPFWDAITPNLGGHRDYPPHSTSCPGDLAYELLPDLRQSVWDRLVASIAQYEVEWLAWGAPGSDFDSGVVRAGELYSLTMSVRNTGWFAWPHGNTGNVVRLGYHWLDSSGQAVAQPIEDDHRAPLEQDVTFGHTYEFPVAYVTTPVTPGTYTLAWDMVHENVSWFHDANPDSPLLAMDLTVTGALPSEEGVRNGGFEIDGEWTLYETAYPARYTDRIQRSGLRSMQTGIENPATNYYSYSSAEQTFLVPTDPDVKLRYWQQGSIASGDHGYIILRLEGQGWQTLDIVRQSVAAWSEVVRDLSAYTGQRVTLRFGTYNDGRGGVSALYIDDVSASGDAPPSPTPVPTSTPTPTPTATPTATPAPCGERALNGDFETNEGWQINDTPYDARYTDVVARTGRRSLQVGIPDPAENIYSYSSAEQRLSIPAGTRAVLRFWYLVPSEGGSGDYGYVLVRPEGGSWLFEYTLSGETGDWVPLELDMSHYAGQSLTLRLGMRNDGRTAPMVMYVDTLSLQACNP
jgi:hypothetical protein